jgi:hypothetical protein
VPEQYIFLNNAITFESLRFMSDIVEHPTTSAMSSTSEYVHIVPAPNGERCDA